MLSAIKAERKSGNEKFKNINKDIKLSDFWSWAYSDLMGNTERGKLAEYIVATAVNADDDISESFSKYDLITEEGIKLEIKTSAYLQSWGQRDYSKIVFNIPKTYGWSSENNTYETERKRQADIYVFCLFKHKDQNTADPLDISQWEFYVLPTTTLNDKCGNSKTVSLERLRNLNAVKCTYESLYATIISEYRSAFIEE